jgi:hypothetical protein
VGGWDSCSACSDNFLPNDSKSACIPCSSCAVGEGYVSPCSDGTDTECVACGDGEYSEGGLSECQGCGANEISNAAKSACLPCPVGEYREEHMDYCEPIPCLAGMYCVTPSTSTPCPKGARALSTFKYVHCSFTVATFVLFPTLFMPSHFLAHTSCLITPPPPLIS